METLRRYLFASLDNPLHLNGSFAIPDRRLRFHAHDVREAILSLTSLIQYRNDQDARKRARLVLDRIQRLTLWDGTFNAKEVAKFPLLADARFTEQMRSPDEKIYTDRNLFNIACWTRGRWIMALCKYYRVTQDAKALELAKRFVRLVRRISFTEDGKIHPTEFDHTHSITGTVHGLIDYGLLVDDEEIVKHGRRIFDVGLASVSSSYGWSVESAWGERQRPNRGEVNNTGDMIQAALLLGRSGLPEYFQDAERRIRGYLLPSQITDGGWGFPGPNDRNGGAGAGSVLDITAGAVQALCETSLTLITRDSSGTRVNLPFTSWLGPTYVTSGLPRKWHIEVTPGQQGSLLARIPSWAPRGNLQVTMAGQPTTPQLHGSWLALMNVPAGTPITVSLPLVEQTVKETVNHQPYQLIYQGDQLVALSPKGPSMPLFPSVEEYQGSKR
ncbi:MAG: beta-L-arabinofuranosidase domain-containing protein [Anaerolineales bacterium]